jgi:hypothetical protein
VDDFLRGAGQKSKIGIYSMFSQKHFSISSTAWCSLRLVKRRNRGVVPCVQQIRIRLGEDRCYSLAAGRSLAWTNGRIGAAKRLLARKAKRIQRAHRGSTGILHIFDDFDWLADHNLDRYLGAIRKLIPQVPNRKRQEQPSDNLQYRSVQSHRLDSASLGVPQPLGERSRHRKLVISDADFITAFYNQPRGQSWSPRALVWVDGRFSYILPPGLYAYWTTLREVAVEVIDARRVRFEHKDLQVIIRLALADRVLDTFAVEQGHVGVLYEDGNYMDTLLPGKYAFWKNMAKVMLVPVDLRETMLDIGGQEIMTADKVTLRLNAVATYRVADAHKTLSAADDARQALYREAQLALRAVIGGRELDQFLADKDVVAKELEVIVR